MCLRDCKAIDNNKDKYKYFFILNNFYKLMITFPFKSKILIGPKYESLWNLPYCLLQESNSHFGMYNIYYSSTFILVALKLLFTSELIKFWYKETISGVNIIFIPFGVSYMFPYYRESNFYHNYNKCQLL